ncbi:MAG: site-specific DNA-methyltransferase, partial [Zoogloeaceae bacterium]|nr:site-specific DNA-methyltransferase [Zoogloeaceae bacterium]
DFRTELAAQLAGLVPEAIADGKVDVQKLKELLGDDAGDESERFGLFWPGKKRALAAAQAPTTATLKPDRAHSRDWDTTQNVFIEGDNLEVLKILQKHYHNKIKLIYIDPPYNTGKDFVYPDNYKEGLETYLEWTRQVNEEGRKVSSNSETEGRYHSNWLNMMYPRLKLARNLLTDDGVIFISIDDNEQDNLKKLCNEVFGEGKFVGTFVWKRRTSSAMDQSKASTDHEYVLAYHKGKFSALRGLDKDYANYSNPDNDPRGIWTTGDLTVGMNGDMRPNQFYDLVDPDTGNVFKANYNRVWSYARDSMQKLLDERRVIFPRDTSKRPMLKRFANELGSNTNPFSTWMEEVGLNTEGTRIANLLFGNTSVFNYAKPLSLTRSLIHQIAGNSDIILDFFAGSGTTAHAVMQLNAEDNGNRRFIMVQLPEPTPEDSEARKAGFKTIADISRKRIELAGEKIKADLMGSGVDTGFRAYKLADTNFTKWRVTSDIEADKLAQRLLDLRDSADDNATADELLTEILLKIGFSLTAKITAREIAGLAVKQVGDNLVLAYLNEHVKPTLEQLRALAATEPMRLIVLEDAFHGDDELKTNLAQLCKRQDIELWTA